MKTGTVKWFNDAKGFGFITPDNGPEDVFAHWANVKVEGFRTLTEGSRVTFRCVESKNGYQAFDITPIK